VKKAAAATASARSAFITSFDSASAVVTAEAQICRDASAAAERQSTARLVAKAEALRAANGELQAVLAGFQNWIRCSRKEQEHNLDEIVSLQTTLGHLCDSVIPGFEREVEEWLGRTHAAGEGAVRTAAELGGLKADFQLIAMKEEEREAKVSQLQTRTEELVNYMCLCLPATPEGSRAETQ